MKKKRVVIGISIAAVLAVCAVALGVIFGVRPKTPPHEHEFDYTSVSWEWEGSEAQASVQCACGEKHVFQADITQTPILPATCEEAGRALFTAKFSENGVEYSDGRELELPASGHDYDYTAILWNWEEDAPTASANVPCKRGEHSLTFAPEIDEEILIEPACESEGSVLYTARFTLGETEYTDTSLRKLLALGHDYASEYEWEDDLTAATLHLSCKRECGKPPYTERVVSTFSHIDPTCERGGSDTYAVRTTYEGKVYDEAYVKSISAPGHDYDYSKVEWLWHEREAKAVVRCKRDNNHSLQYETEIEEEVIKQPTCEEEGEGRYTAVIQREGNRYTDEKILPIPTVAHEYNFAEAVWQWEGTEAASVTVSCTRNPAHTQTLPAEVTVTVLEEASCTQVGITEYIATVTDTNGQEYTDTLRTQTPAFAHTYAKAEFWNNDAHELVCTNCGHQEFEAHETGDNEICTLCGVSTWLYYSTNYFFTDGPTFTASAYSNGVSGYNRSITKVVIPHRYYDGEFVAPVYRISDFAFCSKLESVELPEGLRSIVGSTFFECNSLTEINLPSTLIDIGENAFLGCNSLIEINFPSTLTDIGASAFDNCRSLTEITIPSSVMMIGSGAFAECDKLQSVVFTGEIVRLADYVFQNCKALVSVTLPRGLKVIGRAAFHSCDSLVSIELPNGLQSIGQYAFANCYSLKEIVIPRSVETMGSEVFLNTGASIYCEAPSKPSLWEEDWNASQPVYWAYEIEVDYPIDDPFVVLID